MIIAIIANNPKAFERSITILRDGAVAHKRAVHPDRGALRGSWRCHWSEDRYAGGGTGPHDAGSGFGQETPYYNWVTGEDFVPSLEYEGVYDKEYAVFGF